MTSPPSAFHATADAWRVGPGNPNDAIPCNRSNFPGVPYPQTGDVAVQDGQMPLDLAPGTDPTLWTCTAANVWVKVPQST